MPLPDLAEQIGHPIWPQFAPEPEAAATYTPFFKKYVLAASATLWPYPIVLTNCVIRGDAGGATLDTGQGTCTLAADAGLGLDNVDISKITGLGSFTIFGVRKG